MAPLDPRLPVADAYYFIAHEYMIGKRRLHPNVIGIGLGAALLGELGMTGQHNNAPKWGSITQTILAGVVLTIYAATGLDPIVYLFFWWTVLGGLGVLILMAATSVAVVAFFARRDSRAGVGLWSRVVAPVIATAALLHVLWLTLTQFDVLLGITDPNSPWPVILPSLYGGAALVGIIWALIIKLRQPVTYAIIGLGANSATAAPAIENSLTVDGAR
ncbi:MAG TPA: hypothetical protein VJM46_03360 [Candidatus Saccharimonadales bacterium]|nr:hypothetical protein [Candidatus Saccharimonadales bacterium]